METITVYRGCADTSEQGTTIEEHLLRRAGLCPRTAVKRALREGRVLVAGKAATRTTLLAGGEQIEVRATSPGELFTATEARALPNCETSLEVALETPEFIVVRKPAGQNTHPLRPSETNTTLNAIVGRYPEAAATMREAKPLEGGLIHRLDRGTSGLLVCARSPKSWVGLHALWKSRELDKVYLAWVVGHFSRSGRFEFELGHDPRSAKRMTVVTPEKGAGRARQEHEKSSQRWSAISSIVPVSTVLLETHEPATLILVRLHTGVMHQIRATVAHLGHPVLGDPIYTQQLYGPRPGAISKPLDPDTENLLLKIKEQLEPTSTGGPDPGELPTDGFFLHALYLRAQAEPALSAGLRAVPPVYFGTRLKVT